MRWAQCIQVVVALARARHGRLSPDAVASKDRIPVLKAKSIGGLATVNPTLVYLLIGHA